MPCGFDKGLLAAHYDGETTPEERAEVERHLGTCPECARDLESMKRLSGALKPLSKATAPMSIAEGVMREIGTRKASPRPWLRWTMTAAAALVLAVGTLMVLDPRRTPAESPVAVAAKPAAVEKKEHYSRRDEFRTAPAKQPAAPAEPAPAAEALDRDESKAQMSELKKEEPPAYLAELAKIFREWTGMQFVRVKSPDPAAGRGIVEAFLEERKLQMAPDPPTLSLNNLRVELTDAELKELERRLAAYKEATLARSSLEDELKRVSESRKMKSADDAGPADKEKAARGRAAPGNESVPKRTWVLFVFESAEAKK